VRSCKVSDFSYCFFMSAREVIEQIKSMPSTEKAVVFEYVHQLEVEQVTPVRGEVRYMDKSTFEAAQDRVFAQHSELFKKLAQ
jgi:hypothetical protein